MISLLYLFLNRKLFRHNNYYFPLLRSKNNSYYVKQRDINERLVINIEKFYKIATRYVGDLNKDLVHHVFIKTQGKLPPANPEAYFYRSMMNELRHDSSFRKQHDHIQLIPQEQYDSEFNAIDPDRVQEILNELAGEGFNLEVKVFIEMANDSALKLKHLTGVRYESLIEIRNFVKQEVTRRYGNID